MDWNKAFPETNFNFEDEDIRIEKTVKTLTKVCVKAKRLFLDLREAFSHKFTVCISSVFLLCVR